MSGTPAPISPTRGARTTPHRIQRLWHLGGYAARCNPSDDSGFTLVEVVVSFVIFAIVATSAAYAIANGLKTSTYSGSRVAAANVAQAALQQARADTARVIATPSPAATTTTVGSQTFTVTRTASVPTVSGVPCPVGSEVPVTVRVAWNDGVARTIRMDTVIAC